MTSTNSHGRVKNQRGSPGRRQSLVGVDQLRKYEFQVSCEVEKVIVENAKVEFWSESVNGVVLA
jgi:hypothetical protein